MFANYGISRDRKVNNMGRIKLRRSDDLKRNGSLWSSPPQRLARRSPTSSVYQMVQGITMVMKAAYTANVPRAYAACGPKYLIELEGCSRLVWKTSQSKTAECERSLQIDDIKPSRWPAATSKSRSAILNN